MIHTTTIFVSREASKELTLSLINQLLIRNIFFNIKNLNKQNNNYL